MWARAPRSQPANPLRAQARSPLTFHETMRVANGVLLSSGTSTGMGAASCGGS